jgi:prepilin-type processing-associated H-X9-DG protein
MALARAQAAEAPEGLVNLDLWPKDPKTIGAHLRPSYSWTTRSDAALTVTSVGNLPIVNDPHFALMGGLGMSAGILVPAVSQARSQARRVACMSNLKHISLGLIMWSEDKGGGKRFPRQLKEIYDAKVIEQPQVYRCPTDERAAAWFGDVTRSYQYFGEMVEVQITTGAAPNTMLVWDNAPRHKGGRNVAFLDGHVESLDEVEFQKRLAEQMKDWKNKGQPVKVAP